MSSAVDDRGNHLTGWLQKRGSSKWKERYFMLSDGSLSYYGNPGEETARGKIMLTADSQIHTLDEPLCFQVVTESRCITVKANETSDFNKWSRAVSTTIQKKNDEIRENASHEETHVVSAAGHDFEMSTNYTYIKTIGHGAYGTVISALDVEKQAQVAIKKIPDVMGDVIEMKRIAREIRLLKFLDHDNVIRALDVFTKPGKVLFDVYLVCDLMETDLHRVIYSKQPLTDDHIQYFLYQTLCALKYVHSASVIHRDVKPPNLLLNSDCLLRLCDFGLSRHFLMKDEEVSSNLTEYVVTRWYRAPEIMLSFADYSYMIDVWSVGCTFAEMLNRRPLFPGDDHIDQIKIIMQLVGSPTESELWFVNNDKARKFVLALPSNERADFNELFPDATSNAISLLSQMLVLDPNQRISVEACLEHPYFADVREEEFETKAPKAIDLCDIEHLTTKEAFMEVVLDDMNDIG